MEINPCSMNLRSPGGFDKTEGCIFFLFASENIKIKRIEGLKGQTRIYISTRE